MRQICDNFHFTSEEVEFTQDEVVTIIKPASYIFDDDHQNKNCNIELINHLFRN